MVIILPQPLIHDQSCISASLKAPRAPALHRYTQLKLLQLKFTSSPPCLVLKCNSGLLQLFFFPTMIIITVNGKFCELGTKLQHKSKHNVSIIRVTKN